MGVGLCTWVGFTGHVSWRDMFVRSACSVLCQAGGRYSGLIGRAGGLCGLGSVNM